MIGRRAAATTASACALALAFALLAGAVASAADSASDIVARGKYVFATAGGCACHTPPDAIGLNAGGTKFELAYGIGVVYAPNITPDAETGIGKWTDAQVTSAIRRGERPNGSKLFPIHPYKYLGAIADDEVAALVAYLRSVKPLKSSVPARSLRIPVPTLTIAKPVPVAPRDGLARGAYLADGAGHCTECHTPRRFDFAAADLPLLTRLKDIARNCWRAFGLRGYVRVDFRIDATGRPFVLELNANPCLSPDAGFAAALSRAGIPFVAAIGRIVREAR